MVSLYKIVYIRTLKYQKINYLKKFKVKNKCLHYFIKKMESKIKKDKQTDNTDDNQVWRNTDLIKAVSGILSEIISENKKDPEILKSKIFYLILI